MPNLIEHFAARLARLHARKVYSRFLQSLRRVEHEQQQVLQKVLALVTSSDFGRQHGLHSVRGPADLRRAVPLMTYEDMRPYIERVWDGETGALFNPHQRLMMFATSSGTTAKQKLVPVTPEFVRDYRRGWNTFGLKMLTDHPRAVLRAILQGTGRHDSSHSPAGIPCGAITGLLAQTQKRIVRRFYVGRPEIAYLTEPRARYYTLMRLGITRDVAFAITANPATLIQMARTANEESETLIGDIRDGTLSEQVVSDPAVHRILTAGLKSNPGRAAELEHMRAERGKLRPRDYWDLTFLACWTGGSMGLYLERLHEWYGDLPVRDIGLLASEGRVSIPLEDDTPTGVLDVQSALFEFIPLEQCGAKSPDTLMARELEVGRDYAVVLTNSSGLVRYRLDDVVRMRGWLEQAPLLEFLHRAGRVASIAGEKLTENQAVQAIRLTCQQLEITEFNFILAPCWGDPPYYRLNCESQFSPEFIDALDKALCEQNDEYASRRASLRLDPLRLRELPIGTITVMDSRLSSARGSTAEQYKRPCLLTHPGDDDRLLNITDV